MVLPAGRCCAPCRRKALSLNDRASRFSVRARAGLVLRVARKVLSPSKPGRHESGAGAYVGQALGWVCSKKKLDMLEAARFHRRDCGEGREKDQWRKPRLQP